MTRALLLCALLLIAPTACGDDAVKTFKRAWAEASRSEFATDAKIAALRGLARANSPEAAQVLLEHALSQELEFTVRDAAEGAFHAMAGAEVLLWASKGLEGEEKNHAKRVALCRYLAMRAEAGDRGAGMLLLPALEDKHETVRAAAISGLSRIRRKVVVAALVRCLASSQGRVRGDCGRALTRLTGEKRETAEDWTKWWSAVEGSFSFEDADAPPADEGDDPGRFTTVTRLPPPGKDGDPTIYEDVDSRRVVFVVDFSGSMQVRCQDAEGTSRSRMEYVKEELISVLGKELDEDATFNVIGFSTDVVPWRKKLVKASPSNLKKARAWIRRTLRPDGETNIYGALETAFKHKTVDTIYFLTDGTPTAGEVRINDTILGKIRAWNAPRGVRIHTIGFLAGDGAGLGVVENKGMSKRFLEELAKQNDGSFRSFE